MGQKLPSRNYILNTFDLKIQKYRYQSWGLLRSGYSLHHYPMLYKTLTFFQAILCTKRIHLQVVSYLYPFRGKWMSESPGWIQKLHLLSGTVQPEHIDGWLIEGDRKKATQYVYMDELRLEESMGVWKSSQETYQTFHDKERVPLPRLDSIKWWTSNSAIK